jgi:hypothetical protein
VAVAGGHAGAARAGAGPRQVRWERGHEVVRAPQLEREHLALRVLALHRRSALHGAAGARGGLGLRWASHTLARMRFPCPSRSESRGISERAVTRATSYTVARGMCSTYQPHGGSAAPPPLATLPRKDYVRNSVPM